MDTIKTKQQDTIVYCEHITSKEHDNIQEVDNIHYCSDCIVEKFEVCCRCDTFIDKDLISFIESVEGYVCDSCFDDEFTTCASCQEAYLSDETYQTVDDDYICSTCKDTNYHECSNCNLFVRDGDEICCHDCESYFCNNDDCQCDCSLKQKERGVIINITDCKDGKIVSNKYSYGFESEVIAHVDNISEYIPAEFGITEDGSLNEGGIEIISSPKKGVEFERSTKEFERGMIEASTTTDTSCGLHIHIGLKKENGELPTEKQIHRIFNTYFAVEELFYYMLPQSRMRNTYCLPLHSSEKHDAEKIRKSKMKTCKEKYFMPLWYDMSPEDANDRNLNSRANYKYDSTRYYGCNIHSIYHRGTLELRYHSGTFSAKKIIYWVHIHEKIIDYCLSDNFKIQSVYAVMRGKGVGDQVEKLCKLVSIKDDVKSYMLERIKKFHPEVLENRPETVLEQERRMRLEREAYEKAEKRRVEAEAFRFYPSVVTDATNNTDNVYDFSYQFESSDQEDQEGSSQ